MDMGKSRTKNVIRNVSASMICQLVSIVFQFINRTIFTKLLGVEYLGVSGLFTNILTILSFAELGIGSAIVFRLYDPLAKGDDNKVHLYMNLYKKLYIIIAVVIATAGVLLVPFIKYLVDAPAVVEDIKILYCLYLLQTVVSYVCVYKKSLLIADQKDYVVSLISQIIDIVMCICHCVVLLLTHNFVLYCLVSSAMVLLNNILCSKYVDRRYTYLNRKAEGNLTKEEITLLKKDVKGLILTRVASTVFGGTDNIFISAFVGINYVGILSNYTLLFSTINSVMNKVFNSITASVGNLVSEGQIDKTESVLKRLFFANAVLYGYVTIGMLLLVKSFVTELWLSDEFVLSFGIIFFAITELLLRSLHYPLYITRNALGLFTQYRIIFVISAILNIALDFLLVKPLGISGLLIATIICRALTYFVDVYVVYQIGMNKTVRIYYRMLMKWLLFIGVEYIGLKFVLSFLSLPVFARFCVSILIITIVYVLSVILAFGKTEEYHFFKDLVERRLQK